MTTTSDDDARQRSRIEVERFARAFEGFVIEQMVTSAKALYETKDGHRFTVEVDNDDDAKATIKEFEL